MQYNTMCEVIRTVHEVIKSRCPARVGLLGNPSDGFCGKTLSFALANYCAEVILEQADGIVIVPNPELDRSTFGTIEELAHYTAANGYYGGVRLLQATIKAFCGACALAKVTLDESKGFRISYSSTIPRMVGLSGSSAIILATFNALLTHYQVTIEDLKIKKADLPEFILNIEKQELGIAAGLQDRVIQTYRGLVFMDFSEGTTKGGNPLGKNCSEVNSAGTNEYCPIDESLLPKMYLAYNLSAAGDSGKVHSTVKDRWQRRDPELVKGMQRLASYAQKGAEALLTRDFSTFAALMENNFATRRLLYGDAVVGASNLAMVKLAEDHGMCGKFTGSGGAIVLMRKDDPRHVFRSGGTGEWFPDLDEQHIKEEFRAKGFHFERVSISPPV